jgi:hypothetical protein
MSDLLVGERVHGCEISSSKLASIWEDRRIGFGASILFSWLSVSSVLVTGGGVLRRGIPAQITTVKDTQYLTNMNLLWPPGLCTCF